MLRINLQFLSGCYFAILFEKIDLMTRVANIHVHRCVRSSFGCPTSRNSKRRVCIVMLDSLALGFGAFVSQSSYAFDYRFEYVAYESLFVIRCKVLCIDQDENVRCGQCLLEVKMKVSFHFTQCH